MTAVKIIGTGSYLPKRIVTNEEIAPRLESSSDWILSHTGVETRHVASADESASTMGAAAAKMALEMAGTTPDEIGMIILATTTPDYGSYPSTACLVQEHLGCANAAAFDLAAACSGFVYGLEMAKDWLLCHPSSKALVIGTEILSRQLDWSDRTNAMLFGDGAGAAVLATEDPAPAVQPAPAGHPSFHPAWVLGADGSGAHLIERDAGFRHALCNDPVHATVRECAVPYLKMDGHAVFAFAVRKLEEVIRQLCAKAETNLNSIERIFAHQANIRIIEAVARRMKLPIEKFHLHLRQDGNTSSASIPICIDQAIRSGTLAPGQRVAMVGFGSGLTWAGALIQWPYLSLSCEAVATSPLPVG